MKLAIIAAAVLMVGAGSAMGRGLEVGERVGAYQKGGSGDVVRAEARETPHYSLTGKQTDTGAAAKAADRPQFKANHVHQW